MTNSRHRILSDREDMKIVMLHPNHRELLEELLEELLKGQEICPKHSMKIQIYVTLGLYVYMNIV